MAAARSSSWPGRARSRQRRAPGVRRQVVAVGAGQALGVGVVERQRVERQVVRREVEGGVERRHPASRAVWSGTSYRRSRLTDRDPGLARLGDGVGDVARPGGGGRGGAARASSSDCAPIESRVTPARDAARRVAALVRPGVGLERDLGVGGRARSAPGSRSTQVRRRRRAGSSEGVPPPRYSVSSGGARPPEGRVEVVGAQLELGREGGARTRRPGPAARAPPRRRRPRSRSTGRARRRTGRGRRARPAGAVATDVPTVAAVAHRLARPDDPPALGRAAALLDLLVLAAARLRLAGVTGAQEDREPGDGVAEERGGDAAGRSGQPAADQAHRRGPGAAGSGRGRARRGASSACRAAPG